MPTGCEIVRLCSPWELYQLFVRVRVFHYLASIIFISNFVFVFVDSSKAEVVPSLGVIDFPSILLIESEDENLRSGLLRKFSFLLKRTVKDIRSVLYLSH
jgi:hypothetical protein